MVVRAWPKRDDAATDAVILPETWAESDAEWKRLKAVYRDITADLASTRVSGKLHRDGSPYTPLEYEAWRARAVKAQFAVSRDIVRLHEHRNTLPLPQVHKEAKRRVRHASGWAILAVRDEMEMNDPYEIAAYICEHEPQPLSEEDAAFCRVVNNAIDAIQDARAD